MKFKALLRLYDSVMEEIHTEQRRHLDECRYHTEKMGKLFAKMGRVRAFLYDGEQVEKTNGV